MEIAFASKDIRSICENEIDARRRLGLPIAEVLKDRLADIQAASTIKDLIVGRPRPLTHADNTLVVDLCEGFSLVFCANHLVNPKDASGGIDWLKVSRIKIINIGSGYV
jgi:hypothetical protein